MKINQINKKLKYEKDHGLDMSFENEVIYDK